MRRPGGPVCRAVRHTLTENLAPVTQAAAPPGGTATHGDGPAGMPLGKLAVDEGLVTHLQLAGAFAEQFTTGKRIGEILQARGLLTDSDVARLLALQKGLRFVHEDVAADFSALSREESSRVDAAVVMLASGERVAAVSDPAEGTLERVREAVGHELELVIVPATRLAALLGRDPAATTRTSEHGAERPASPPTIDVVGEPPTNGATSGTGNEALVTALLDGAGRPEPQRVAADDRNEDAEKLAATEAMLTEERQAVRRLEEELEGRRAELETATQDIEAARGATVELERGLSEATAELVATRQQLDATRAEEAEVAGTISETTAELERRLGETTGELAATRHELDAARAAKADVDGRLADTTAHLERRLTEATHELTAVRDELEAARAANAELDARLAETTGGLEQRLSEATNELTTTRQQLDAARAERAELDGRLENTIAELERRLAHGTSELTATRQQLDAARAAKADVDGQLAQTTAELERRLSEAMDELTATKHELDVARAAKAEVDGRLAETTEELERRLAQATAELERRLEEATAELTATRREVDAVRNVNDAELARLRAEVAQREGRDGDLIHMLESVTAVLRESTPGTARGPSS